LLKNKIIWKISAVKTMNNIVVFSSIFRTISINVMKASSNFLNVNLWWLWVKFIQNVGRLFVSKQLSISHVHWLKLSLFIVSFVYRDIRTVIVRYLWRYKV